VSNEPAFNIDAAERLAASGIPTSVIAQSFCVPESVLVRTIRHTELTPEDRQLQTVMRSLAFRAAAEAQYILNYGHPNQRMSIIRTVLGRTAGLIGQESTSTFEESREAIGRIFAAQTQGIESQTPSLANPLPIEDIYAPEPAPSAGGVDYPRQTTPFDEDTFQSDDGEDWR
jgi:hypothetical protein